jgi:hypothetical protein
MRTAVCSLLVFIAATAYARSLDLFESYSFAAYGGYENPALVFRRLAGHDPRLRVGLPPLINRPMAC